MAKHPKSADDKIRDNLKKKYGSAWRRYFLEKKTYPFGKKSKPLIIFEKRINLIERKDKSKKRDKSKKSFSKRY